MPLEQVRQLRHLSRARRMAGQASSRAARSAFRRASGEANGARERGQGLMVSLAGRHKEVERLLLAGHHKEVARPLQPNAARDATTRKEKGRKESPPPGPQ